MAHALTSFIINPGPPANATVAQVITFGKQYHNAILIGAWLQAVSPLLIILFALAIVHLAGAATRFAGWMTMLGGAILVMVSLVEVTFYLNGVNSTPATVLMNLNLVHAVQHDYSMVAAPAVFFPLGVVILGSRVLPHVFGYLAFVLGGIFAIAGVVGLFSPIQNIVNALSILQAFWFLAAAITLIVFAGKASETAAVQDREGVTVAH